MHESIHLHCMLAWQKFLVAKDLNVQRQTGH